MAEEAGDHLAAQVVVLGEAVPLHGRREARGAGRPVRLVVLRVLRVDVVHLADRRDAEAVQVAPGVGRVPLEVPVQGPVDLGLHDLVVRQGEVVHPDVDVAGRRELLDARDEDRELLGPLGEVRREHPLGPLEPRDVRVRVHRHPVRVEPEDLVDAVREALQLLPRQAVDHVQVDRGVALLPGGVHQPLRQFVGLDPVDQLLDLRVEVLHAHRHPVEAAAPQDLQVLRPGHARVHLDRDLGVRCGEEGLHDVGREAVGLGRRQVRRRPAPPVDLEDGAGAVDAGGHHVDLAVEVGEVPLDLCPVLALPVGLGDHLHEAAAEPALLVAERQVEVERHGAPLGVRPAAGFLVVGQAEGVGPLGGGRVGGVAGPLDVVLRQELRRHRQRLAA